MNPVELFTLLVYQPFFNVLLFLYWGLGEFIAEPNMGWAVIFLTLFIRFLLLPLSFSSHKSEEERRTIAKEVKAVEEMFSHDPVLMKKERRRILRAHQSLINAEIVSFVIQLGISLMLWRIFETGLTGKDFHLIYPFMPEIEQPLNLVFLNRFDLSHTSFTLNFIQSLLIFVLETVSILTSPYPPAKGEVVRMQLVLPVVSFLIFLRLPAGKKLFIITSLIVSIIITILKFIRRTFKDYAARMRAKEAAADEDFESDQVLVQTK